MIFIFEQHVPRKSIKNHTGISYAGIAGYEIGVADTQ
jgi:hypothetical protein